MTAPTTTLLAEVHAGRVEFDRYAQRFTLHDRPMTCDELDEWQSLRADGLVYLLADEEGVRYTPADTTTTGKRVMVR